MQRSGLDNDVDVAYFQYDFSKQGGAVGDILVGGDSIPQNAVIRRGMIDVQTAATSGGLATIAVSAVNAADVLGATAVASFSLNAMLDVVPVNTAATSIRAASADIKQIKITVAVAALTAGVFTVALEYLRPR